MGEERLAPELHVVDDGGTRAGVRRALEEVAEAGLLVGPYGSDLVDEAARWAAEHGRVLWNHGGSADEVERLPGVVSVPSPAGRYLGSVLESLADSLPGARVLVAAGRGLFGRSAALGAGEAADRLGMTLVGTVVPEEVSEHSDADVVLAAGTFADDLELVRRLRARPARVAAVAAGISLFGPSLGPAAEGILGPSQWEEGARFSVDVGPRQADAVRALRAEVIPTLRPGPGGVDYPAAQAYATGLIAMRCVEEAGTTEDHALLEAARGLRCATFFGRFRLGGDGRQEDHEILVVQWQEGAKRIVWPPSMAEASPIL
jgi:branched-chain amino acid transport system substrate-binding protein